jgi:hypothetical protein
VFVCVGVSTQSLYLSLSLFFFSRHHLPLTLSLSLMCPPPPHLQNCRVEPNLCEAQYSSANDVWAQFSGYLSLAGLFQREFVRVEEWTPENAYSAAPSLAPTLVTLVSLVMTATLGLIL